MEEPSYALYGSWLYVFFVFFYIEIITLVAKLNKESFPALDYAPHWTEGSQARCGIPIAYNRHHYWSNDLSWFWPWLFSCAPSKLRIRNKLYQGLIMLIFSLTTIFKIFLVPLLLHHQCHHLSCSVIRLLALLFLLISHLLHWLFKFYMLNQHSQGSEAPIRISSSYYLRAVRYYTPMILSELVQTICYYSWCTICRTISSSSFCSSACLL